MSDLSIPGVTDKYNTQKIIDALMAVKKEPLTRMQKELDTEQQKKTAWQDITRKLSGLRDMARTLYGFQNPFNDRVAASSDESTLVATATRQAVEETKQDPREAGGNRRPLPLPRPFPAISRWTRGSTRSRSATRRCPLRGREDRSRHLPMP